MPSEGGTILVQMPSEGGTILVQMPSEGGTILVQMPSEGGIIRSLHGCIDRHGTEFGPHGIFNWLLWGKSEIGFSRSHGADDKITDVWFGEIFSRWLFFDSHGITESLPKGRWLCDYVRVGKNAGLVRKRVSDYFFRSIGMSRYKEMIRR